MYSCSSPEVIDQRIVFKAESKDEEVETDSTPNQLLGVPKQQSKTFIYLHVPGTIRRANATAVTIDVILMT